MIQLGKKVINADTETILYAIKDYILRRDGRTVLKDIKPTDNNIMITCPFHKDGNERRPSCGVSTIDVDEHPAGTVHCFTCGTTMYIDKLISYLLRFEDSGEEGRKWLLENFDISYNRDLTINITRDKIEEEELSYIPESLLQQYRYYHPYMFKRGLTEEIIELYDIGYDQIENAITFPVRDKNGKCIFLAKRSVEGKLFRLPMGKNKPLYGIYELDYSKHSVFIVESFFNALTLRKWGYNAVALMGTGSSYQYKLINNLPFRQINICLDGDMAGRLGTKKLVEAIRKDRIVYEFMMFDGKDVNDLTYEEFMQVPSKLRS